MSNEAVTFSVVIPAYNAQGTLGRAVDSCLQQTYGPHEIIVVDDASTDDTETFLKDTYGDKVIYLRLVQNAGSAVARNKGIDRATGSYIAFLDADDIWHERKLEIAASILGAKKDIYFLYHSYTLDNIHTVPVPESATIYRLRFIKLLQHNPIATPCAIVKNTSSIRFESSMRYSEDYDLWLRVAYKYKAYFINVPLTQIGRPILSAGGVSVDKWKMRKGELKAFRRLMRLNPLFLLAMPFLFTYSLGKHALKAIVGN
jgi:teichuronic acid biosynthesis glycosyltransferase TuaG